MTINEANRIWMVKRMPDQASRRKNPEVGVVELTGMELVRALDLCAIDRVHEISTFQSRLSVLLRFSTSRIRLERLSKLSGTSHKRWEAFARSGFTGLVEPDACPLVTIRSGDLADLGITPPTTQTMLQITCKGLWLPGSADGSYALIAQDELRMALNYLAPSLEDNAWARRIVDDLWTRVANLRTAIAMGTKRFPVTLPGCLSLGMVITGEFIQASSDITSMVQYLSAQGEKTGE